ncbi:MAG: ImmA/IrrE family metallo-endopeptidase [Ignavibacteriales bacterium]|nr:ImmA/IrrE family metallo-endopeptidase [Ignavibacteriales bacterium]
MSLTDLLSLVNEGLKNPLTKEDISGKEIEIRHLKRIDKIFNKGLHYYLDPKSLEASRDASIFFRKTKFGTALNIGAKKIVNQFEEFKISLSGIAKLAELKIDRILPVFKISQDPKKVAQQLRINLYPSFNPTPKEFLKALIAKLAEYNILVFEFVETWNKKEKANIDGFFLNPNVIVLKRQQISFRREIFTLIHELGHYLLNKEEIEQLDVLNLANSKLSAIEKWCNDFSYYFLAGDFDKAIESIDKADGTNDYQFDIIEHISKETHLSEIALFTRLLFQNKISRVNYNKIKTDKDEEYRRRREEEKKKRELDKLQGLKTSGSAPKPINSQLLISTIQTAFYERVINEYDVCKTLNISPDKLERYLQ